DTMAEDYLLGNANAEAIKTIFMHVDETRDSIIEKKKALEEVTQKFPKFRAGLLSLATAWLQLHREAEALETLEKYDEIEKNDPIANYYMTVLYAERMYYSNAWKHLKKTEEIIFARNHHPKTIRELRQQLALLSP